MAGREGLIDTAVKTSRSGYLQRCLVKGLEELKVHYDYTVRDADLGVVQFVYGEDGVDPMQSKYLDGGGAMGALAQNYAALAAKYSILHKSDKMLAVSGLDTKSARAKQVAVQKAREESKGAGGDENPEGEEEKEPEFAVGQVVQARRLKRGRTEWVRGGWKSGWVTAEVVKVHEGKHHKKYSLRYEDGVVEKKVPVTVKLPRFEAGGMVAVGNEVAVIRKPVLDPVISTSHLGMDLGAVSEKFQDAIDEYVKANPDNVVGSKGLSKEKLETLLHLKYMKSLAAPGEAVGSIAGQSIGEPSTQMTLNTFHLAGHGGANVTLGIPRLREIIMSASQNIKTPSMAVPYLKGTNQSKADRFAQRLRKLQVAELIHHEAGVIVTERLNREGRGPWERHYHIKLQFYSDAQISQAFGLTFEELLNVVSDRFLRLLTHAVAAEMKKTALAMTVTGRNKSGRGRFGRKGGADEGDGDGDNDGEEEPVKKNAAQAPGGEDEDEDDEENAMEDNDEAQGTLHFGRKGEGGEYDEDESDDDDEEEIGEDGATEAEDQQQDDGSARTSNEPTVEDSGRRKSTDNVTPILPSAVASHTCFRDFKVHPEEAAVEIIIRSRASQRRVLMVPLVESVAAKCPVRSSNGISQAFVVEGKSGLVLQTAGCNLEEVWEVGHGVVQLDQLTSNDIWAIHQTYGVEAARTSIMAEIGGVFGAYGISVDPRHLGLVSDFMTYQGGFRPLNRMGMRINSSPFLQMSFETTSTFLTEAAIAGEWDNLATPSAKLVMGQVSGTGTGGFQLMVPIRGLNKMGTVKQQEEESPVKKKSPGKKKTRVVEQVA